MCFSTRRADRYGVSNRSIPATSRLHSCPHQIFHLQNRDWHCGHMFLHPLIHSAVCLTTGPKPLPKQTLHTVRSRASSFRYEYPLLSLRPSSSFIRLFPHLPVTSIPPFIFPSTTCRRRQFLQNVTNPVSLPFSYFM
jgi:hypothetical protein